MILDVTEVLKDNLYIIEHPKADVTVTYNKEEFDKKVKPITFINEYYDYNKPHKVTNSCSSHVAAGHYDARQYGSPLRSMQLGAVFQSPSARTHSGTVLRHIYWRAGETLELSRNCSAMHRFRRLSVMPMLMWRG